MLSYPQVRGMDSGGPLGGSELLPNAISELKFDISEPLRVLSHLLFLSPHEINVLPLTLFTNEAQRSPRLEVSLSNYDYNMPKADANFLFNSTKSFKPKEESGTDKVGMEGALIAGSRRPPNGLSFSFPGNRNVM